jgi:homoserine dehydrogenase
MNVALLGFGVVGQGVYDIIHYDFKDVHITKVLVKNPNKHQEIHSLLVDDLEDIINDETIECVIECVSSKTFAYQAIKSSLQHHKHVVSANKAVISDYFEELMNLAKTNDVRLLFEASVGAAIILLDPIKIISKVNHIHEIKGIVNGSTNYILSRVFLNQITMEKAIEEANEKGYLETGSDDDMSGLDPMRKINILSMIAYHTIIAEDDIFRLPLIIKYMAISKLKDNQLSIIVEPIVMDKTSIIANVHYEENIINVYGRYHDKQSFIGQGAGRFPTAQAMVYDLQKIIDGFKEKLSFNHHYHINNDVLSTFLIEDRKGHISTLKSTHQQLMNDTQVSSFIRMEEGLDETI